MRRMSFFLTQEQVLSQTKTVTRRDGWRSLMPGDLIQPIVKGMGLKKGEKQQLIGCPILIKSISVQRLHQITKADCILEGFPDMEPEDFIKLYLRANGGTRNKTINRIEFEYTEPL